MQDSVISRLVSSDCILSDDMMLVSQNHDNNRYSSNKINFYDTVSSSIELMGNELSDITNEYLSVVMNDCKIKTWCDYGDFTVRFFNGSNLVKKCLVLRGQSAIPPKLSKQGYEVRWDKDYTNVQYDLNIYAIWQKKRFTIKTSALPSTYGSVTGGGTYDYASQVYISAHPGVAQPGYKFSFENWSGDISDTVNPILITVLSDMQITGNFVYVQEKYTVKFLLNGGNIDGLSEDVVIENVTYGEKIVDLKPKNPTRPNTAESIYTFDGWSMDDQDIISSDTEIQALWSSTSNTVTAAFKNWDGKVLNTQKITKGTIPTLPSNPTRQGYDFTGWKPTVGAITTDTTYTAQYTKRKEWKWTPIVYHSGSDKLRNAMKKEGYNWSESGYAKRVRGYQKPLPAASESYAKPKWFNLNYDRMDEYNGHYATGWTCILE